MQRTIHDARVVALGALLLALSTIAQAQTNGDLVPSGGGSQTLPERPSPIEREVGIQDPTGGRQLFQWSVFGDWMHVHGPFVGASVGMYRGVSIFLGGTNHVAQSSKCPDGICTDVTGKFGLAYGVTVAALSINRIELSGGAFYAGRIRPLARLSVPLDLPWMPVAIPDARIRVSYPFGIGLEWGSP